MKPTVGRLVHYVSHGTPDGKYGREHRAAIVTKVGGEYKPGYWSVGLAVLSPTGLFFDLSIPYEPTGYEGGSWHWPEREDSDG